MMTTKTIQRRIESLEKEERFRKRQERGSLTGARIFAWEIVFAYYLCGLVYDKNYEESPGAVLVDGEWTYPRGLRYSTPLSDEVTCHDVFGATAKALKCASRDHYWNVCLLREPDGLQGIRKRHIDAYHRLFAKVGLDFDSAAPHVLFDAFVTMINELPERWLDWLRSSFRERCHHVHIPAGSNLPWELNAHNFILFA